MAGNGRRASGGSNGVLKRPDKPLGPELPDAPQVLPNNHEWLPIVRHWYNEFRVSPQAELVRSEPMWMAVTIAFVQLNEMLISGKFATMSPEVRQLFGQFGWTPAALRALKFDIPLADDLSAGVADMTGKSVDFAEFKKRRAAI